MEYVKNGFKLGQILPLDGKDVIITGFHAEFVFVSTILIFNNGEININNDVYETINHSLLEAYYEAYVAGLGYGSLAAKGIEKYINKQNPFEENSRNYLNYQFGYEHGFKKVTV